MSCVSGWGRSRVEAVFDKAGSDDPAIIPISRPSLHGELVERLRDMIIEGQLSPGSRINEGHLAAALGVSRTPMREAIKYIASEGLIELVPGRGAVIKALTPRDVREMLQVLCGLETMAARIGCRIAAPEQIARIQSMHDRMMRLYESRDRLEYYKLNQAIHTGIALLADNRLLVASHGGLQARLKRIRFLGHETPAHWAGAVAEHEAIIDALAARDGDRLADLLTRHLDQAWERVRDII